MSLIEKHYYCPTQLFVGCPGVQGPDAWAEHGPRPAKFFVKLHSHSGSFFYFAAFEVIVEIHSLFRQYHFPTERSKCFDVRLQCLVKEVFIDFGVHRSLTLRLSSSPFVRLLVDPRPRLLQTVRNPAYNFQRQLRNHSSCFVRHRFTPIPAVIARVARNPAGVALHTLGNHSLVSSPN